MRHKSSEEILANLKENYEIKRRIKYEEFLQKYFYRQIVTNEKQNEYKTRLKNRALESKRRHEDAANRRNAILEDKKNKIIARKQSRSESRDSKSSSISEMNSSSKPGTFVGRVSSSSEGKGTAGFGRGYSRRPEPLIIQKQGINLVNTAVFDCKNPWKHSMASNSETNISSANKLNESSMNSNIINSDSFDWTACEDILEFAPKAKPTKLSSNDENKISYGEKKYIIPEKQLKKFIEDSRKYRSIKSMKKVSFDSIKTNETRVSRPVIKKSLQIDTPETKRGILLKMFEVNAKNKANRSPKYEAVPVVVSELAGKGHNNKLNMSDIHLAGKGDSISVSNKLEDQKSISQSTNTEIHNLKPGKNSSATMKETIEKALSNCGRLLQTRENEKKTRKLKLTQLHEDLKNIEKETRRLTDKNVAVSKNIMSKSQTLMENNTNNHFEKEYFQNLIIRDSFSSDLDTSNTSRIEFKRVPSVIRYDDPFSDYSS